MEVSIFFNEKYNQCCQKVSKDLGAQHILGHFIIILSYYIKYNIMNDHYTHLYLKNKIA